MDGNLNGKEMTADLESMKAAGLGNLVFLEVDVGIPKGPVRWMTAPWQELFVKTVRDAERLGIDITFGIGPDWGRPARIAQARALLAQSPTPPAPPREPLLTVRPVAAAPLVCPSCGHAALVLIRVIDRPHLPSLCDTA